MTTDRVHWFDPGPIPIYFGVCLSEKAFQREIKRLKVDEPVCFIAPGTQARCHCFENGHATTIILAFDPNDAKGRDTGQIVGLIAHESSHAADYTFYSIGEDNPGPETRAYLVQWFTQCAYGVLSKAAKKAKTR